MSSDQSAEQQLDEEFKGFEEVVKDIEKEDEKVVEYEFEKQTSSFLGTIVGPIIASREKSIVNNEKSSQNQPQTRDTQESVENYKKQQGLPALSLCRQKNTQSAESCVNTFPDHFLLCSPLAFEIHKGVKAGSFSSQSEAINAKTWGILRHLLSIPAQRSASNEKTFRSWYWAARADIRRTIDWYAKYIDIKSKQNKAFNSGGVGKKRCDSYAKVFSYDSDSLVAFAWKRSEQDEGETRHSVEKEHSKIYDFLISTKSSRIRNECLVPLIREYKRWYNFRNPYLVPGHPSNYDYDTSKKLSMSDKVFLTHRPFSFAMLAVSLGVSSDVAPASYCSVSSVHLKKAWCKAVQKFPVCSS